MANPLGCRAVYALGFGVQGFAVYGFGVHEVKSVPGGRCSLRKEVKIGLRPPHSRPSML